MSCSRQVSAGHNARLRPQVAMRLHRTRGTPGAGRVSAGMLAVAEADSRLQARRPGHFPDTQKPPIDPFSRWNHLTAFPLFTFLPIPPMLLLGMLQKEK